MDYPVILSPFFIILLVTTTTFTITSHPPSPPLPPPPSSSYLTWNVVTKIGLDLHDGQFLHALKLFAQDDSPPGYDAWLDKNISFHDPIFRGWRMRETIPLISRRQASFKCWDDRCVYYIYGFSNPEERDEHLKQHTISIKRDSGLSVGTIPPIIFSDQSSSRLFSSDHINRSSPATLPRLSVPPSLPPLANATHPPRDRRESAIVFNFGSELPPQPRRSIDSEPDSLLPPLKRSRVGHGRLESIGELRLPRDTGPCLRCKVQSKPVRKLISHRIG